MLQLLLFFHFTHKEHPSRSLLMTVVIWIVNEGIEDQRQKSLAPGHTASARVSDAGAPVWMTQEPRDLVGVGELQGLKNFLLQVGLEIRWSSRGSEQRTSPELLSKQQSSFTSQHLIQASSQDSTGLFQEAGAASSWALGVFAPKSSEK